MIPFKYLYRIFLLILCAGFFFPVYGKVDFPAPQDQRETAISLFREGQYEKALPLFSKLNYDFPYDFLLKYFTGACLVETGDYGVEAEKNLILASSKEVPARVFYYLGKLYHARGSWNSAQRFYNRFVNNSDTLQVRELKIEMLSDLCYRQVNPFAPAGDAVTASRETLKEPDTSVAGIPDTNPLPPAETVAPDPPRSEDVPASIPESAQPLPQPSPEKRDTLFLHGDSAVMEQPVHELLVNEQPLPEELPASPEFIHFRINEKVVYLIEDMFQEEEALKEFRLAEKRKSELDSLLDELEIMRKRYHEAMNPMLRDSMAGGIRQAESLTLVMKGEVDAHFRRAASLENEWWKDADFSVYQTFIQIRDSVEKLRIPPPPPVVLPEMVMAQASADTIPEGDPAGEQEAEPEAGDDEDTLTYRIQIGAYSKAIPAQRKALFDKISKIRVVETFVNEEGVTVYTTGNLTSFDDAVTLQNQVRLEGVKDAFVIAMKGGKRVPLPK